MEVGIYKHLRPDEAIIYHAEKSTHNQLSDVLLIPVSVFFCCFCGATGLWVQYQTQKPSLQTLIQEILFFIFFTVIIVIGCMSEIRYEAYLTNQRIILYNRFTSKITSFELDEIDEFYVCPKRIIGGKYRSHSGYIEIGDKNKKRRISNIKLKEFEAEFKKLRPDFTPKVFPHF
ncbi:MAG: hypothetical protein ACI37Z_06580 [Candidatus Gastranaerophilaceae bacterium]